MIAEHALQMENLEAGVGDIAPSASDLIELDYSEAERRIMAAYAMAAYSLDPKFDPKFGGGEVTGRPARAPSPGVIPGEYVVGTMRAPNLGLQLRS